MGASRVVVLCGLLAAAAGGLRAEDAEPAASETARLRAEIGPMLEALEGEAWRRRVAGRTGDADDLTAEVAHLRARLGASVAPAPGDQPELHVVALETGAPETYGGLPRGRAVVEIECPGRPLVLVLGSANAMHWDLRLAEGVEIVEVWHCGDARHWVRGVTWGQVKRLGEDFAWRREDRRFALMEAAILKATGLPITTFLGARSAGAAPLRLAPDNEAWRIQQLHAEAARLHWNALREERARAAAQVSSLRFEGGWPGGPWRDGRSWNAFASYGPSTPLGPLTEDHDDLPQELARARAVVRDVAGGAYFALGAGGLLHYDVATRRRREVPVPDLWPAARDPRGLALDTRRRRVLMATRDGVGYLYALDLDRREWSVLGDMDHVDVAGLCYDARADRIYCVSYAEAGGMTIHRIAPDGSWEGEAHLPVRVPDERRAPVQLHAAAGRVVVVQPPVPDRRRTAAFAVWAAVAEPLTGQVLFEAVQRPFASGAALAPGEREILWAGLLGDREERRARRLADGGDETVAFLRDCLLRAGRLPTADVKTWVQRLGDDSPAVRQQAQVVLESLGGEAQEGLAEAAAAATTPEVRLRLAAALRHAREAAQRELQRALLALQVLEWIASPDAVALLEELAERDGELGRNARAAVLRLGVPP